MTVDSVNRKVHNNAYIWLTEAADAFAILSSGPNFL
jgi:hypothetical protein